MPMRIASRRYRETGQILIGGKFKKATPPPMIYNKRRKKPTTLDFIKM
jgi:hypothetical protein